jgi:hypothetical protein
MPLTDRIDYARAAKRASLSAQEIADEPGVISQTVRQYWAATPCPRCGEFKVKPDALVCRGCRGPQRSAWGEPFTRSAVVASIRDWTDLEGTAPRSTDWRPLDRGGHPRWTDEFPRWPPRGAVDRLFSRWHLALVEAGAPPNQRKGWTRAEVLVALQHWRGEHGRWPVWVDWLRNDGVHRPSGSTVARMFGAWSNAIVAAGGTPSRRRSWTAEEILNAMGRWRSERGSLPRQCDWQRAGDRHPSASTVRRVCGSWSAAVRGAERLSPLPG